MRGLKLRFLGLLVVIGTVMFSAVGMAADPADKHFLWKVSSPAGTGYLLGSVHFGKESMYPLPTVITDAFEQSDALVVEINMANLDPTRAAALFLDKGMYKGGASLQSEVQPGTWQALSKAAEKYGLMLELFQLQKPWVVALSLSAAEFRRAGYSENLGLDHYFLQRANGSKPILELESLAQQVALFEQFSQAEQEEFLVQTLQELDKGVDYLTVLLEAWNQGDAEQINTLIAGSFTANPISMRIYQRLFTDRNVAMAQKIEELLTADKTYFIVVGAGHLVSDEGILQLLTARGYSVEQL